MILWTRDTSVHATQRIAQEAVLRQRAENDALRLEARCGRLERDGDEHDALLGWAHGRVDGLLGGRLAASTSGEEAKEGDNAPLQPSAAMFVKVPRGAAGAGVGAGAADGGGAPMTPKLMREVLGVMTPSTLAAAEEALAKEGEGGDVG